MLSNYLQMGVSGRYFLLMPLLCITTRQQQASRSLFLFNAQQKGSILQTVPKGSILQTVPKRSFARQRQPHHGRPKIVDLTTEIERTQQSTITALWRASLDTRQCDFLVGCRV